MPGPRGTPVLRSAGSALESVVRSGGRNGPVSWQSTPHGLGFLGNGGFVSRHSWEDAVVNDPNVKGLVVGICLAVLVGIFGSLAVDTFFGREDGLESPLRRD